MYRNTKSRNFVTGANITLWVDSTSKTNLSKKRSDLWLQEMGGGGKDKLKEGSQKVKTLSYKIN